jgi:hypothetical protein
LTDYLSDVFVVDGPAAGGAVPAALLVDGAGGVAGDDAAGGDVDPADVSFFSPAAAGVFSPSDGGFSLLE